MGNLSDETRKQLEALGVHVKAFDPIEVEAVMRGHRTFAELANISKEWQLEMANRGLQLLNEGNKDKAREIFLGLEALDPYDAYVQAVLGQLAVDDEEFEEAETRFTKAISINPISVPALVARGELYLRHGRRVEGKADLEKAVSRGLKEGNEMALNRANLVLNALKADDAKAEAAAKPAPK